MILISKTFEIITEESAQDGEAAEMGFLWEDAGHTFRELIALLQEHQEASYWPVKGANADGSEWFSSQAETDYRTGETEITAIHYSRANDARSLKYWKKAIGYVFGK